MSTTATQHEFDLSSAEEAERLHATADRLADRWPRDEFVLARIARLRARAYALEGEQ